MHRPHEVLAAGSALMASAALIPLVAGEPLLLAAIALLLLYALFTARPAPDERGPEPA